MSEKQLNFVKDNNVHIYGEFDDGLSEHVTSKIFSLIEGQSRLKNGKINIHINSYGGETSKVWELISLFEYAKSQGIKICTYALSAAHSCGSMLAIIGNERYIGKNSVQLVHLGYTFNYSYTVEQLRRSTKNEQHHFDSVMAHYKKYSEIPDIEDKLKDDLYYIYADELIEYKMADKFIEDINKNTE